MSHKPDSTKHHSLASLFNGINTIGDVFGTQLDDLRASNSLRMRLQRGYTTHDTWFGEIAVVETKVRAAIGPNQIDAINQWLHARQILSGILTGVNKLDGISLEQAIQRMLRAGVIRIARTATAARFLDGRHEHNLPESLLTDALSWFAHASRIDNKSTKDLKAPWNLVQEIFEPSKVNGEPNPLAGQHMPCCIDMLDEVLNVIRALEETKSVGGIKTGHLCFGKVAGPLMPLASLSPTKDGMETRRRRGSHERTSGKMSTEQFVELKNYPGDGTIYVMRLTSLKGRLSVNVCVRNVYLGSGKKLPDGRVDYSTQTRMQKGTTKRLGNDWVDAWQPLPASRRLDRGDGDTVLVWQPFAMYENANDASTTVDKLSAFLARMGLECDGIIGLSWGQKRGDEEVFLSMIRQIPEGSALLADLREEMFRELAERQQVNVLAKAVAQVTTKAPEMLADGMQEQAKAVLADNTTQEVADPEASQLMELIEQHAPAPEAEQAEQIVMRPVAEEPAQQEEFHDAPAINEEDEEEDEAGAPASPAEAVA